MLCTYPTEYFNSYVTIGGYAASAGLAAWSARCTRNEDLPKLAVMTAAFFVASLIHVPFGPTSVHLLIPGLTGALLGSSAFLSIGRGTGPFLRLVL